MPPCVPAVDAASVASWCTEHLGSAPAAELFRSGHLSVVIGVRLADGREVVVKIRPASPRIAACVEVQRRMFESGYPCPEPLGGPAPLDFGVATAESYAPGGVVLPPSERASQLSALAFARLIRLAPRPADVSSLDPPPSWAAWNHGEHGLWPRPEGAEVDLNEIDGPEWIDRVGARARERLRAGAWDIVIGHCDWLADNVRWKGDELLVVPASGPGPTTPSINTQQGTRSPHSLKPTLERASAARDVSSSITGPGEPLTEELPDSSQA